MRKSTSSSDSSDDDDDDYPISKIQFKINPTAALKSSTIVEESDEAKISNAMRLVDKNIGHFATYSRSTRTVSQSLEDFLLVHSFLHAGRGDETSGHEQIDLQRPNSAAVALTTDFVSEAIDELLSSSFCRTLPTSVTTDQLGLTTTSVASAHQENIPPLPSRSLSSTTGETRKSLSIDDDNEVASTIRTRQSLVRLLRRTNVFSCAFSFSNRR